MIKPTLRLATAIKLLLLLFVLPAMLATVIGYWPPERYLPLESVPVQPVPWSVERIGNKPLIPNVAEEQAQ